MRFTATLDPNLSTLKKALGKGWATLREHQGRFRDRAINKLSGIRRGADYLRSLRPLWMMPVAYRVDKHLQVVLEHRNQVVTLQPGSMFVIQGHKMFTTKGVATFYAVLEAQAAGLIALAGHKTAPPPEGVKKDELDNVVRLRDYSETWVALRNKNISPNLADRLNNNLPVTPSEMSWLWRRDPEVYQAYNLPTPDWAKKAED